MRTAVAENNDAIIRCTHCGRRLADLRGRSCSGDVVLAIKCPRCCGIMRLTPQHIEKILANKKNI